MMQGVLIVTSTCCDAERHLLRSIRWRGQWKCWPEVSFWLTSLILGTCGIGSTSSSLLLREYQLSMNLCGWCHLRFVDGAIDALGWCCYRLLPIMPLGISVFCPSFWVAASGFQFLVHHLKLTFCCRPWKNVELQCLLFSHEDHASENHNHNVSENLTITHLRTITITHLRTTTITHLRTITITHLRTLTITHLNVNIHYRVHAKSDNKVYVSYIYYLVRCLC